VVMLDPPGFLRRAGRTIQKALTGYKEINLRGMKAGEEGWFPGDPSVDHHPVRTWCSRSYSWKLFQTGRRKMAKAETRTGDFFRRRRAIILLSMAGRIRINLFKFLIVQGIVNGVILLTWKMPGVGNTVRSHPLAGRYIGRG